MPLELPLRTDRLTLRLHALDDDAALLDYYSRPQVARYLLDEPWDESTARTRIRQHAAKDGLDGPMGALAVVVELEGRVVGDVTVWRTDRLHRRAEIGWVFSPDVAGRGVAAEACRALIPHLFKDHGLQRIEAQMDERNAASARLAERLGMTREAAFRENWWNKGEWTSTLVYGLTWGDVLRWPEWAALG